MGEAKKKLTPFRRTLAIVTLIGLYIYSIVNIVLVVNAYVKLASNIGELKDLIKNWQTGTIQELTVNTTCPAGYEPAVNDRVWHGIDDGCWCGDVIGTTVSVDRRNCQPFCKSSCSSEAIGLGCKSVSGRSSQTLNFWGTNSNLTTGSNQICVKRSAETYASMAKKVTSSGGCPSNHTKCGSSPENVFCTQESKCPINSVTVRTVNASSLANCTGSCSLLHSDGSSVYKTISYTRGDTTDKIPTAQFTINEYGMCDLKATDNITPGRANFFLLKNQVKSTCGTSGNIKWNITDTANESVVFEANGLSSYISSLDNYTASGMKGYYQTNMSDDSYNWNLFTRSYVPWHLNCRDDMHYLIDKAQFVTGLQKAQLAVVIIGCISGLVLGIGLAVIEIQNLRGIDSPCIKGEGDEERDRILKIKKVLNLTFKFLQIPFQVWAIVLCGMVKQLLTRVANRKCSDADTNETLAYLAATLSSTFKSTICAIALLFVSLIFDMIISSCHKKKDPNNNNAVTPAGNNTQNRIGINDTNNSFSLSAKPLQPQFTPSPHFNLSPQSQFAPQPQYPPQPQYAQQPQYPQYPQQPQYSPLMPSPTNITIQLQTMPQQPQPQYPPQQYPPQQPYGQPQYPPQQQYGQPQYPPQQQQQQQQQFGQPQYPPRY